MSHDKPANLLATNARIFFDIYLNIRAFVAKYKISGNLINKKSTLERMLNILNLSQIIFPKLKHLLQE